MVPGGLCAVMSLTPVMLQLPVRPWEDSVEVVRVFDGLLPNLTLNLRITSQYHTTFQGRTDCYSCVENCGLFNSLSQ